MARGIFRASQVSCGSVPDASQLVHARISNANAAWGHAAYNTPISTRTLVGRVPRRVPRPGAGAEFSRSLKNWDVPFRSSGLWLNGCRIDTVILAHLTILPIAMKKFVTILFASILVAFSANTTLSAQTAHKSVIHVVTVKGKSDVTPKQIEAALDCVKALPKAYPGITRVWTK